MNKWVNRNREIQLLAWLWHWLSLSSWGKSLPLWSKFSSFLKKLLDYRISKKISKSNTMNMSMTATISNPKNIAKQSWELGTVSAHISSIWYMLCQIINSLPARPVYWDFRSTSSSMVLKGQFHSGSVCTVNSCSIIFFLILHISLLLNQKKIKNKSTPQFLRCKVINLLYTLD